MFRKDFIRRTKGWLPGGLLRLTVGAYTDSPLSGVPAKKLHVDELRQHVK